MFKLVTAIFLLQMVNYAQLTEIIDKGDHLLECRQEPLELGIVLDASTSIGRIPFKKAKDFLKDFTSGYQIGPDAVRVSLISYGLGIYTQEAFNLTDYTTGESLQEAIENLNYLGGPHTSTGDGISYMATVQMSQAREGIPRVAIVVTDGNSQKWRDTRDKAKLARDAGIIMIAVGVGEQVKDEELLRIAGDDTRAMRVESYGELRNIMGQLAATVCVKKLKPTTPPPPKTVCGEDHPADVYFVFSPVDIGVRSSVWMRAVIGKFINTEDIQHGFRVGVATGDCPTDFGFDLDQFLVPESNSLLLKHLNYLYEPRLTPLVDRIIKEGFSEGHGGRADARDVVILTAPGGRRNKPHREVLVAEAEKLVNSGKQVIILDPTDNDIKVAGATTVVEQMVEDAVDGIVASLC